MKKNILLSGSSKNLLLPLLLLFSIALPIQVSAQVVALDRGKTLDEKRNGWLPYFFATESLGTAIGAGMFTAGGKLQPQSSLFGTAFVTSNKSALVSGAWNNHRFGKSNFFFDGFALADQPKQSSGRKQRF
jgi:hypothetical protein